MRFLTLSAVLLILSLSANAQAKNDAKIIVTPSDTAKLFDKLITLLYTEGYTVRAEDKARGIIVTDMKSIDAYYNPDMRLRLIIDSTVTITGEVKPNMDLGGVKVNWMPIENSGAKKTAFRVSWDEMDRVAKLIGATTYAK